MKIRIAATTHDSIVDGPGIRFVVFTQGCLFHCPGCHNPETHPLDGGVLVEIDEIIDDIKTNPLQRGLTLTGGEPFLQAKESLALIEKAKPYFKDILVYSGYTFEELQNMNSAIIDAILTKIDYLIDGKYIDSLRDLTLPYRGSSNQRIIDVQASLTSHTIVLKDFSYQYANLT